MITFYAFGLLALGLVFITLEVFIPSLGMLGIMAALSIISGGVVAYLHGTSMLFVCYVLVSFVLIPTILIFALKIFPKTPVGKHFTLSGPTFNTKEAQAVEAGLDNMIGLEGPTLTSLRPAGIALLEDRRVDVVTRGEMIEKDVPIRVIKVEGNRVVVEKSDEGNSYST